MSYRLSRMEKLKSRNLISKLFTKNRHVFAYPIKLIWTQDASNSNPGIQVMVSVSKRNNRHAVDRNKVKRLIREAYRTNKGILNKDLESMPNISLGIIYVGKGVLSHSEIEKGIISSLKKMRKALDQS